MKKTKLFLAIALWGVFAALLWAQGGTGITNSGCTSCTNGQLATVPGDLEITGNVHNAGTLTFNGGATFTGFTTTTGGTKGPINAVTDTDSLTAADCGTITAVTAGIDTKTITLPAASTVPGCTFTISYVGADGGALLDISPLDTGFADGIEGGCTLAASVVTFSGTADADIGLTKATGLTGDFIRLTACGAAMWCVTGCEGIWANN